MTHNVSFCTYSSTYNIPNNIRTWFEFLIRQTIQTQVVIPVSLSPSARKPCYLRAKRLHYTIEHNCPYWFNELSVTKHSLLSLCRSRLSARRKLFGAFSFSAVLREVAGPLLEKEIIWIYLYVYFYKFCLWCRNIDYRGICIVYFSKESHRVIPCNNSIRLLPSSFFQQP